MKQPTFFANDPAGVFLVLTLAECKSIVVDFHYFETLTLEFLNGVTPSYVAAFTAWILKVILQ
jgi:hypothetical protein